MSDIVKKEEQTLKAVETKTPEVQAFELLQRKGKMYAASKLVPKAYQNNPADCSIANEMAGRLKADPMAVMQNLDIIHGNPAWRSKFLISCVNTCGNFSPLRYEFFGEPHTDQWSCRAWAYDKNDGEKLYGTTVSIAMAKAEGWYGKAGSKWKTIPELMLQYRAAAFFTRVYAPEITMGMQTQDEAQDLGREVKDVTPSRLNERLEMLNEEIKEESK